MQKGKMNVSLDKLKDLYESLKQRPSIEVGVFSNHDARDGSMTNATLAAIHEFGAPEHGLPMRSVLKQPIQEHAKQIMESVHDLAHKLITKEGAMQVWKLIGVAAEKIVIQAFDTGGFGKWAPLKYGTLLAKLKGSLKKRKGMIAQIYAGQAGSGILIASGQLRRSYSSRVRMRF
jgi:phage gpG-like protein